MLDQTLDLFHHAPAAPASSPTPAPGARAEIVRRFTAWRTADDEYATACGRWQALDDRGADTRAAGAGLHEADTACERAVKALASAPITDARDAVPILAALILEHDRFGEMSADLGIDLRALVARLAPFLPST